MLGVTASSVPATLTTHVHSASIRKSGALMICRAPEPDAGRGSVNTVMARDSVALCHCPDRQTPEPGRVIAQGEREVANLVTERTLIHHKEMRPVFLFCLCSHVAQRRYDVERHDV